VSIPALDPAKVRQDAARSIRHPLSRALLLLTFSTGVVDAGSYLGLGHVFTANMTGNIVLLGFGIGGAAGLPVVAPLVSLAAFLLGAGTGGWLGTRRTADKEPSLTRSLMLETVLITGAAVIAGVANAQPGRFSGYTVIALLAFALGFRNATVRKVAVPDLSTTVLTMTLTGLAADSKIFGGPGSGTIRRSTAVVSMLVGAVCGALLVRTALWIDLALAAVLAAATLAAYRAAGPSQVSAESRASASPAASGAPGAARGPDTR
jgi:uncharacterized membrane protein YoaK (UPF0700 family)